MSVQSDWGAKCCCWITLVTPSYWQELNWYCCIAQPKCLPHLPRLESWVQECPDIVLEDLAMQASLFLPEDETLCLAYLRWIEDRSVELNFIFLEHFELLYYHLHFSQYFEEISSQAEFQYCDQSSSLWFASAQNHIFLQIEWYFC